MNPNPSNIELAIRDIHLPDSNFLWPLAPGWWMLLLLLVLVIFIIFIYKKTWFTRRLKKNIKLELAEYFNSYNEKSDTKIFVQQLSVLLRRVSLYLFQEKSIAKLQGVEWLEFLDSKLPPNHSENLSFKSGVGQIFSSGPYQKNINEDISSVYELVEQWLTYNLKNKYGFM